MNRPLVAAGNLVAPTSAETVKKASSAMQATGEFLDYTSLKPGSLVDVETESRHYQIECLGGEEIRISGHPEFCPMPVDARLKGSLNTEGILDSGLIERGMRLVFVVEDRRPVTTSRVLHMRCA